MAVDMFLKLDGIKGEAKDSKHKDEIDILSWSFGVSQTGTMGLGGGGGAGKANFQDISITKHVDKASPSLFLNCATGKHMKDALLTCRKAGGTQLEYLKIKLSDLLVTSVSGGASGGEDRQTENISLNFSKIEIEYHEQDAKGADVGTAKAGYDVKQNQKV